MRRGVVKAIAALGVCSVVLSSCIIAEPISDLPAAAPFRPTILRGSVAPTASVILVTFPEQFYVPVELVDPSAEFKWRMFIDYDERGEDKVASGTSSYEPGSDKSGVRVVVVQAPAPTDTTRCHVIEFVAARAFTDETGSNVDPRQSHTPTLGSGGGDSVTWFYSPSGDLSGCPVGDAAVKVTPPDSGAN